MIYSPYRTSVTKQHQDGKRLADCAPDTTNRRSKSYLKTEYQMGKRAAEDAVAKKLEQHPELQEVELKLAA